MARWKLALVAFALATAFARLALAEPKDPISDAAASDGGAPAAHGGAPAADGGAPALDSPSAGGEAGPPPGDGGARAAGPPSADADAGPPPVAHPSTLDVVPPVVEAGGDVPYPVGATGDAEVVLELLVGKDGHVQDARVVVGAPPFAEAAREASKGFVFRPAMRGAEAVAARIRMKVSFAAPVEVPAQRALTVVVPQPKGAPKVIPVEEVEVHGQKKEAGKTTLGRAEIRDVPGAFGDAFRAIETLPGVVPLASGLPFFFVRGAPSGNTGYFIDGVRVPLLYHLALGPSVIHPGLVDHVDFYAGAPPARFGRFAGGFVSGELREPAKTFHGEGNIRLFDTGLLVETPFANGKGTFLGGGRVSYTALLLSAIAPEVKLGYWDYQSRITYDFTPKDRLSVFVFGSHDYLGEVQKRTLRERTLFATQFHRLDLRYDRKIDGGRIRVAVTGGLDSSNLGEDATSRGRMLATRFELEKKLSDALSIRLGADGTFDHYDLVDAAGVSDDYRALYPPRNDFALGARADVVWKVHPRVEVVPGLRFDLFGSIIPRQYADDVRSRALLDALAGSSTVLPAVDPRLAVRTKVSSAIVHVSTLGVQHQSPSFAVPVPGLQVGTLNDGLQSAIHASQGLEVALPWKLTLAPTAFVANQFGLTDAISTCGSELELDDARCVRRVAGRTYGLELSLRRSFGERLTGFVSYTLSRSTRKTRPIALRSRRFSELALVAQPEEIAGEFDRTHVLNVAASYQIGAGWRAGARFFFYTGRPYSETVNAVPLPPFNAYRFPDFYRIDLRVEKRWTFGKTGYVSFVAEWLNATLRKEAFTVQCARFGSSDQLSSVLAGGRCAPEEIGPVTLPSLGVEGGF